MSARPIKSMLVIKPSGEIIESTFTPDEDGCPPLAQLQHAVDGYIELIYVHYDGKRCIAFCNEHANPCFGAPKRYAPNPRATDIARASGVNCRPWLYGNLVIILP